MANLRGTKFSSSVNFGTVTPSYNVQRDFGRCSTTMNIAGYWHIKTSLPFQGSAMWMIEAVGYAYGVSQSIRCAWTGYSYASQSTIFNPQQFQAYPGLTADGQYYSTDNCVVLRAYSTSTYFTGFNLTAYQLNPSTVYDMQVISFDVNTNAGAFY